MEPLVASKCEEIYELAPAFSKELGHAEGGHEIVRMRINFLW